MGMVGNPAEATDATSMYVRDSLDREWATLSRLLDDGLELPHAARSRWVESLPPEHDALRSRLRSLLCGASPTCWIDRSGSLRQVQEFD
jgi:hypothetical protein